MHRQLALTVVVATVLALLAGTGAAATADATVVQDTADVTDEPTAEGLSTHDEADEEDDESESADEEDDESESDGGTSNQNNVGVVNVQDELVVDLARGHVGDGSEHPITDDDDGSDGENSNQNNVAVVNMQDNQLVKE